MRWILATVAALFTAAAYANDIGHIKTVRGSVHVERDGKQLAAVPGLAVRQADRLVTGSDGAVGLTFLDNSMLSAGPGTILALDRYQFDSTTHVGHFDASLQKGSLAGVSGKIVQQTPGAMRVRTPASVMGVRGTDFLVQVDEPVK